MLTVGFDQLLAEAEKAGRTDRQAAFLFRFTARGKFAALHVINLAAHDVPVAGLGRLQTLAQQQLAVAHDRQSAAEARKIDAWPTHCRIRPCRRSA
ncbi:hypothetical protein D3C87_1745480 [compost metagenome]